MPSNTGNLRKETLSRLLTAAAGLASEFDSYKEAGTKVLAILQGNNQNEILEELAGYLPIGHDTASICEDPIIKVLDLAISIIPRTHGQIIPEKVSSYEPVIATVGGIAPGKSASITRRDNAEESSSPAPPRSVQQSRRWSDWDEDDEDDWMPSILEDSKSAPSISSLEPASETVPGPAVVMAHKGPADYELAAEMAQELAPWGGNDDEDEYSSSRPLVNTAEYSRIVPEVSQELNEAAASDIMYACTKSDDYEVHPFSSRPLPSSHIQSSKFLGHWIDNWGIYHKYFGEDTNVWNGTEWVAQEGYYWDRHPLTPQMSAYERLTMNKNSVSISTRAAVPGRRTSTARDCVRRVGLVDKSGVVGQNMTQEVDRQHKAVSVRLAEAQENPLDMHEGANTVQTACSSLTAEEAEKEKDIQISQTHEVENTWTDSGIIIASGLVPSASPEQEAQEQPICHEKYGAERSVPLALTGTSFLNNVDSPIEDSFSTAMSPAPACAAVVVPAATFPEPAPAPMTALEFLISRGLYRDRNGHSPQSTSPPIKKPRKPFRLRDLRPSWMLKLKIPVKFSS
ncbi:hypothetical protein H072_3856 [Dactylellina haptotyla CBS 200.50]|uniref:Uncharacterized protein n=1 Tax=Dactylellina haptotyla (strain CBS 200.50) TaxID=1284197 RepID=S8C3B7_DACHA|nr:hypothetical protein H072_3856 [Dactylellina haptotyla CBS 200.50]